MLSLALRRPQSQFRLYNSVLKIRVRFWHILTNMEITRRSIMHCAGKLAGIAGVLPGLSALAVEKVIQPAPSAPIGPLAQPDCKIKGWCDVRAHKQDCQPPVRIGERWYVTTVDGVEL